MGHPETGVLTDLWPIVIERRLEDRGFCLVGERCRVGGKEECVACAELINSNVM